MAEEKRKNGTNFSNQLNEFSFSFSCIGLYFGAGRQRLIESPYTLSGRDHQTFENRVHDRANFPSDEKIQYVELLIYYKRNFNFTETLSEIRCKAPKGKERYQKITVDCIWQS